MARWARLISVLSVWFGLGCEREPIIRPAKSSAPITVEVDGPVDSARRADSVVPKDSNSR